MLATHSTATPRLLHSAEAWQKVKSTQGVFSVRCRGSKGPPLASCMSHQIGLVALCDRAVCADMQTCVGDIAHRCGSARQASRSAVRRRFSSADNGAGLGLCPVEFGSETPIHPLHKSTKDLARFEPQLRWEMI